MQVHMVKQRINSEVKYRYTVPIQVHTFLYLAFLLIPFNVHIETGCYLLMHSSPDLHPGQHSTAAIMIIIMMTIIVAVTVAQIRR